MISINRYLAIILCALLLAGLAPGQEDLEKWADRAGEAPAESDEDDAAKSTDTDEPTGDASGLVWPPPEEYESVLLDGDDQAEETDDEGEPLEAGEVPPSQQRGREDGPAGPPLPIPGSALVNRLCTLHPDPATGWVLIYFPDEPDRQAEVERWALPNRMLEYMERIVADEPATVFRISGENTRHGGLPFLLIRKATVLTEGDVHITTRPVDEPDSDDEDADATTRPASAESTTRPALDGPTTRPASAESTTRPAHDEPTTQPAVASSDEVLEQLFQDSPGAPVLPRIRQPYELRPQPASQAPVDDKAVVHPGRGHMVIDRLVTFLPVGHGNWVEAVFEADNNGQEPPLRVLPSALVPGPPDGADPDSMVGTTQRYWVSGEITEYRGRRYLLLRKALVRRDMGQF